MNRGLVCVPHGYCLGHGEEDALLRSSRDLFVISVVHTESVVAEVRELSVVRDSPALVEISGNLPEHRLAATVEVETLSAAVVAEGASVSVEGDGAFRIPSVGIHRNCFLVEAETGDDQPHTVIFTSGT